MEAESEAETEADGFAEVLPCLVYSHRLEQQVKHVNSPPPESFGVERTSTGVGLLSSRSGIGNFDSSSTFRCQEANFQHYCH